MPLLREINPKAGEHISAAITRLRQDNDVLRAQASPALSRARETEDGLVIPGLRPLGAPRPAGCPLRPGPAGKAGAVPTAAPPAIWRPSSNCPAPRTPPP
jgi:hypothetical protein